MNRADWIGRLICAAGVFGVAALHSRWFGDPENTIVGMAVYLSTSAICNAFAVIVSASFMRGRAAFDMQRLAFCAIVVNLCSFLAYSAKISPLISALNTAITVISYAQLARLLWPSNGNLIPDNWRNGLFRFSHLQGKNFHLEKTK